MDRRDGPAKAPADCKCAPTVLCIDDDPSSRLRLQIILKDAIANEEIRLLEADSIPAGLDILASTSVQVAIVDKNLGPEEEGSHSEGYCPPDRNGICAIPEMLGIRPELQILIFSGSRCVNDIVRAMNFGAANYIPKDSPDELVLGHLKRAIQNAEIALQREWYKRCNKTDDEDFNLAGNSKALEDLRYRIKAFSESDSAVMLLGETGTGKTTIARAIHNYRNKYLQQSERPFFGLNIAALNENTVASELFGHEEGSFSGAKGLHRGFVELANQGTLFLDEIADASLAVQALLLKVIDEGKFFRVGGTREMKSHFKLICATHKNLKQLVAEGKFRHDLYMRLTTFTISVPSLVDRKEDIPAIIEALLPDSAKRNRVTATLNDIPQDYITWLQDNVPEGNIRGIDQQLARLLVLAPKDKEGRPILKNWRAVLKIRMVKLPSPRAQRDALTYSDLMSLPMEIFSDDFPGMVQFIQDVERRVYSSARAHFGRNREIARRLKISESAVSMRFRALLPQESPAIPTSPPQATN